MYRVAVIGSSESIKGFAALGLGIYETDEPSEALRMISALSNQKVAVIYLTEVLYTALEEQLEPYQKKSNSWLIIPIPGISGNTGVGLRQVSKSVEKAVGSDILG